MVSHAAEIVRKGLYERRWTDGLPGERSLSIQLGVSRPTLRKALGKLRSEGLLETSQGKPTRPTKRALRKSAKEKAKRRIILLSPDPLHRMPAHAVYVFDALRTALAESGHSLETRVFHPKPGTERQAVAKLLDEDEGAIRILYRQDKDVHREFHGRGAACVVFGNQHPNYPFPAAGIDHPATCRHAINHLQRNGFTRSNIALLVASHTFAGDMENIAVIREELGDAAHVFQLPPDPDAIPAALDRICKQLPVPAALVFVRSRHVLSAISHLCIVRRLRVPDEISFVCLSHDPVFDWFCPAITRYQPNSTEIASSLATKVLRIASGATPSLKPSNYFPEFIRGGTVGRGG